jgi:hypothetical protein
MKFIKSSFDPETGISTVVMQHMGKKFTGVAKIHPEEKDHASEIAGCAFAETRAIIKALKYERKLAKEKADMAIDFVKSCECYTKFNKEDAAAKSMYRQLNQRIKRVNDITDEINAHMEALNTAMFRRQVVIKAFKRKKMSKKDN